MSSGRLTILYTWLIAASCTGGDSTTEKSIAAARADSSAAGYAVGGDTSRSTSSLTATSVTAAPAAPTVRRDTMARDTSRMTGHAKPRADTSTSHRVADGRADSTGGAGEVDSTRRPPLPFGLTRVNEFLSYDAQKKTATLLLTAGYNGLNDALNYNGGARGSQGVSIPLGWTVLVSITNHDSDLRHSAIVVRQMLPPPEEMPGPAFVGASVPQLEEGVAEGDTANFAFVADKRGRFMIACGVPGHAQGGMWMRLTISSDIDRPGYR